MGRLLCAVSALAFGGGALHAGGLDRTGLPIDLLFETGNIAQLGFARTLPNLSGTGNGVTPVGAIPRGTRYEGVGEAFNSASAGIKLDITPDLSAALLFEQPFGAGVAYGGDPATTELGGTRAFADTDMITALLRYKFTENWSVHGGIRVARSGGDIDLRGLAYGPAPAAVPPGTPFGLGGFNGYSVSLDTDTSVGWVLGLAYEIPDIALRVALTYNSEIVHEFDTVERFNGNRLGSSTTEVELPRSVALDFQTGIAEDTLLFGRIRWAEWSAFRIDPELFTQANGAGLVALDDWTTWTLGLGRRFTDTFAARASVSYETPHNDLVSPLSPTNGFWAASVGGAYTLSEQVTLSGGVRYTWIGDAQPETGTPDVARAAFNDNEAVTVGFNIAYRF